MAYRSITVILERDGWKLTSYGYGAAYLLEDTVNKRSVFFQDDDASEFSARIHDDNGFFVDHVEERFADYSEVMT